MGTLRRSLLIVAIASNWALAQQGPSLTVADHIRADQGIVVLQVSGAAPGAALFIGVHVQSLQVPTAFGTLFVDPSTLPLLLPLQADATGSGSLLVPIPDLSPLFGVRLYLQAIQAPTTTTGSVLSNLATTVITTDGTAPRGFYEQQISRVRFDTSSGLYIFSSGGTDLYSVDPSPDPDPINWPIQLGRLTFTHVPTQVGALRFLTPKFRDLAGTEINLNNAPYLRSHVSLPSVTIIEGQVLQIEFTISPPGWVPLTWRTTARVSGKSLVVQVQDRTGRTSALGNFSGLARLPATNMNQPGHIFVPFVQFPISWSTDPLTGQRIFFSNYVDFTRTSATVLFQNNCQGPGSCSLAHSIEADTQGQVMAALDDTLYVTGSPNFLDTMPRIVSERSPYFNELRNKIPMESFAFFSQLWTQYQSFLGSSVPNSFVATDLFFQLLDQCGVREVYGIWQYNWNPTSQEAPEIAVPPGNFAPLNTLLGSMAARGVRFALGVAITYISPGSSLSSVLQPHIPLDSNGQPRLQTPVGFTGQWPSVSYPGQMVLINTELAALKAALPSMNSFFLDSDFKQLFAFKINNSPLRTGARSLREVVSQARATLRLARQVVGGPLFGEGYKGGNAGLADNTWQFYGESDGQEKEYPGQRDCFIIPHYSLFEEARVVNNRAPYISRFQNFTINGALPYDQIDWDDYFAQALAFNHQFQPLAPGTLHQLSVGGQAPFQEVSYRIVDTYYRAQALQTEFNASPIAAIHYFDDVTASFLTIEQALPIAGFDFQNPKIRLTYASGLVILINFRNQDWTVALGVSVGPQSTSTIALPRSGWAAWRVGTPSFVAFSGKLNTAHVDYVRSNAYTYGNGRGTATDFGAGFVTTYLRVQRTTAPLLVTGTPTAGVSCP